MSELIDNRAQRVRTLKEIIERLHAGEAPDAVRTKLKELVRQTSASEIVSMEEELIAGGTPVEQITSMCDLHSQVTREVLVQLAPKSEPLGHPADTFRRENDALRVVMGRMRETFAEIAALPDDGELKAPLARLRQAFSELMDIDKHYQRKEHVLFSYLEKHGISGPSKVMWAKDDEVRGMLKQLGEALRQTDGTVAEWKLVAGSLGEAVLGAIEEMMYKEEKILLPMCADSFTEQEWGEIWASSPRYGWCLVEPGEEYRPPEAVTTKGLELSAGEAIQFPTGNLTIEQLLGIFTTLPLDITFVDADDRVAFFSEGPDRVFARSKAVIGRKVQYCHPPGSVDIVERILSDFREGRQDVAEFWINFQGRFVHIRYFAVRDAGNKYIGTLEVTQDATPIRKLEGERRLLQYDDARADEPAA